MKKHVNGKILSSDEMKEVRELTDSGSGSGSGSDPCFIVYRCSNGNIVGCVARNDDEKCNLYPVDGNETLGVVCGDRPPILCSPSGSGSNPDATDNESGLL